MMNNSKNNIIDSWPLGFKKCIRLLSNNGVFINESGINNEAFFKKEKRFYVRN